MPTQYNPRTVFRQTPNQTLQEFFSRYEDFAGFDWTAVTETKIEPIFAVWQRMPDPRRQEVAGILRRIHAMANPRGTAVLVETGNEEGIDLAPVVRQLKNAYARAFRVFLDYPQLFAAARTQFHIAMLPRRSWEKRNGLPRTSVAVTGEVIDELRRGISVYYLDLQGRGDKCKVDYRRRAGVHSFYAYPADYPDEIIGYGDDGELARHPWNPAFEVVFRFDESAGTMDEYAEGGKRVRADLAGIFARVVLRQERQPELWEEPPFNLELLKGRNLAFPTDPADAIDLVRVTGIRVRVHQRPGGRLALDVDGADSSSDVYALLDATLDEHKISLANVTILEASLQAVFRKPDGKACSVSFKITSGGSHCDLGDSPEEEKLRRYLRVWGIERDVPCAA